MQNDLNPGKKYALFEDSYGIFIGIVRPDNIHFDMLNVDIIAEFYNLSNKWQRYSGATSTFMLSPRDLKKMKRVIYYETYEEFIAAHFEHVL